MQCIFYPAVSEDARCKATRPTCRSDGSWVLHYICSEYEIPFVMCLSYAAWVSVRGAMHDVEAISTDEPFPHLAFHASPNRRIHLKKQSFGNRHYYSIVSEHRHSADPRCSFSSGRRSPHQSQVQESTHALTMFRWYSQLSRSILQILVRRLKVRATFVLLWDDTKHHFGSTIAAYNKNETCFGSVEH